MDDGRPPWDQAFAESLEGAVVLVGITRNEPPGPRLEQFYGTVVAADPQGGIRLMLSGSRSGETYHLPPDLRALFPAAPGSYRLRETGETVVDPDYTTTWDLTPPTN
ncbi:MAG: hypothetical protein QOI38_2041 [Sphingomonadales bacterium]|jgi:hypothetical protein|nr:hypothetical protein [Sphingomonadales bacterium]